MRRQAKCLELFNRARPCGQRLAMNLAPADLRKEGSAFDLPMALELAGCQGQFFGRELDKIIFLGE